MITQILILTAIFLVGFAAGAHIVGGRMAQGAMRFATDRFGTLLGKALEKADLPDAAKAEVARCILEEMSSYIQKIERE